MLASVCKLQRVCTDPKAVIIWPVSLGERIAINNLYINHSPAEREDNCYLSLPEQATTELKTFDIKD